jgi:hypothetical protein
VSGRFSVENRVGRLIEARVRRLSSVEDADAYGAEVLAKATAAVPRRGAVLCADHRPAGLYPPLVADRLVELFRPNNVRFERIAILVSPKNVILIMQLERLTREAGSDKRKVFQDALMATKHLAMALDAAELDRVRSFLLEG